ncbi:MAG: membrane dipeptidase [Rhizobacter sp.]
MRTAAPVSRRQLGLWALGSLFVPTAVRAQAAGAATYIGDMHSHITMLRKDPMAFDLRKHMADTGTTLMAWAIIDDHPWVHRTQFGLKQSGTPAPGELWALFQKMVAERYEPALKHWGLSKVLVPADVDAALAGKAQVVMASESANFLEGQPERVAQVHAMGLRHLQLVHYIHSPLGDLQTEAPHHHGLPPAALKVIQECQRLGILVDLAHSPPEFVDAAFAASDATMIWSHSWVSRQGGSWKDSGYLARSLSPAQAKRIAARGGVVGLWSVRVPGDSAYPLYSVRSYANEIMRMVDLLGPEAVAFGTDMDGAGRNAVLSHYADVREVVENLAKRGLPEAALHNICIGNYARVLKKAMTSKA